MTFTTQLMKKNMVMQAALTLLMAFKQARHYHPHFLTSFCKRGLIQLSSPTTAAYFNSKIISGTATSLASHTLPDGDAVSRAFVTALLDRATETLEDFTTQVCADFQH